MALTTDEIKSILKEHGGGTYQEHEGPIRLAGDDIYEVWALKGDEYWTRFIIESENPPHPYYERFSPFSARVDKHQQERIKVLEAEIKRLSGDNEGLKHQDRVKQLQARVAAVAFLVGVGVLAWKVLQSDLSGTMVPAVWSSLVGLVASGGAFFFGRWIGAKK